MGNTPSIYCEICDQFWGALPVLNISTTGTLDGHNVCIHCYQHIDKSVFKKSIESTKSRTCAICYNKSKTTRKETTCDPVFRVHWYGKLGDTNICETCLFNKVYKK